MNKVFSTTMMKVINNYKDHLGDDFSSIVISDSCMIFSTENDFEKTVINGICSKTEIILLGLEAYNDLTFRL